MFSDIQINWLPAYKIVEINGKEIWKREWLIPVNLRSPFFIYWKSKGLLLKSKGYSVMKKETDWFLIQTTKNINDFDKSKSATTEETDFELKPIEVKHKDGLRPWQVDAVSKICAAINKWGAAIDGSDLGIGKCHSKGTKIRMYDGTLKNVENIVVGDVLMGDDSSGRNVTGLASGIDDMYEIVPTNGGVSWGCNKEHILILQCIERKQIIEISVKDYLKKYKNEYQNWKLIRTAVNYTIKNVSIDPYLMGLWIGDKTWNSASITAHRNDTPIIDYLRGITHGKNELWDNFKSYGFGKNKEKFIPNDYLINSTTSRQLLLAGLIDSDGNKVSNGCYTITTKWKKLCEDIIELSRSLGYEISVNEKIFKNNNFEMNGIVYYVITISGAHDLPLLLNRKKSSVRKQLKSVLVSGFNIINKGKGEYYGFTLDGNHRYLLEDFTITHNTYTACGVARELNMDILVVCPKAVMESWKRVIKNHFNMNSRFVGVINYESLRQGKSTSDIASYVKRRDTRRNEFVWKIPKNTLIVWDESQKLKNSKTKNSETCLAALKQGYKMLFCSATNATNPLELKTVGMSLGLFDNNKQYYNWLYSHGVTKGRFGMEFNGNKEILKKLHRDIFVNRGARLTRDAIPNFPETQISAECFDLEKEGTDQINKAYAEMQSELAALNKKIKKENKEGANRLTAELRARQKIELLKIPIFIELIEDALESNMSVVVFLNFDASINALSHRFQTNCIIRGENADEERQRYVDEFQSDKERLIIINIQSGGAGLSLHDLNGKHPRLSLISPCYSAVLMRQATGRIWRDGGKSKSIQKIVFVSNTIEELVCEKVKLKLENLDTLNDGDLHNNEKNISIS